MKKRMPIFLVFACILCVGSWLYLRSMQAQEERLKKEARAWQQVKEAVLSRISRFKGEVGLVVQDLSTGRIIRLNPDKAIAAASMVKVPVMAAYFEAEAEGAFDTSKNFVLRNRLKTGGSGKLKNMPAGTRILPQDLVELMISESDNTAANMLIMSFGYDYLNAAFKRFGLRDTTIVRKMMDFSERKNGVDNYTSATDLALLFKEMYFGRLVNKGVSQRCLEILKKQRIKDRIPLLLPEGTVVAHKTGLEYGICHDAGIVYTPRGNFLLCVLVKHNYSHARPAKRLIARVAKEVYDYFLRR